MICPRGQKWQSSMIVRGKIDDPVKTSFLALRDSGPISIAESPDGVWHIHPFASLIAKTCPDGKVPEWGDRDTRRWL